MTPRPLQAGPTGSGERHGARRGAALLGPATILLALLSGEGCGEGAGDIGGPNARLAGALGTQEQALVNGTLTRGYPYVGKLIHRNNSLCTATLVGREHLLTAAHCVDDNPAAHTFTLGDDIFSVIAITKHPQYREEKEIIYNDIAVLKLAARPPVRPLGVSTTPPPEGTVVTLVGYGQTSHESLDAGVKRSGQHIINHVDDEQAKLGFVHAGSGAANICKGDSGGPTLALLGGTLLQVGVHSSFIGDRCGDGGRDMRVDLYVPWILEVSQGDLAVDGQAPEAIDLVAPTVTIQPPTPNEANADPLRLSAKVSDEGAISHVELEIEGQVLGQQESPPYEFKIFGLEDGAHELTVRAFDDAGNAGSAQIRFFRGRDNASAQPLVSTGGGSSAGEAEDPTGSEVLSGTSSGPPLDSNLPRAGGCAVASPTAQPLSGGWIALLALLGLALARTGRACARRFGLTAFPLSRECQEPKARPLERH